MNVMIQGYNITCSDRHDGTTRQQLQNGNRHDDTTRQQLQTGVTHRIINVFQTTSCRRGVEYEHRFPACRMRRI